MSESHIRSFKLALTIVLTLLIGRFRYLFSCSTGANDKISMLKISLDENGCKKCFVCLEPWGRGMTKLQDVGSSTNRILCADVLRPVLKKLYVSQCKSRCREDDNMHGQGELRFIGIVEAAGEEEARVRIFPEFCDALNEIDGFSHIIILYWFHLRDNERERSVLQVVPRRHTKKVKVGVFACRSPSRPNPIGLCVAKLMKIENRVLIVKGLDAFESSPIIDIKPYIPRADSIPKARVPEWTGRGPPT